MAAADYLESGSPAQELSGCSEAKVTINTDKWGSETSYEIRNSDGEVVFKNGPYANQVATYTDEFKLPDGCYEFELKDSYGEFKCSRIDYVQYLDAFFFEWILIDICDGISSYRRRHLL